MGKRLFSCGRGAPWCSPPFNGYWGWPGARTHLKSGLGSWNRVTCDISFFFQGHSGGKAEQHVLIKQVLSWRSPGVLLSTCSSILFSSLLFSPLYSGVCVCSAPLSGSQSLLQFEEYKPNPWSCTNSSDDCLWHRLPPPWCAPFSFDPEKFPAPCARGRVLPPRAACASAGSSGWKLPWFSPNELRLFPFLMQSKLQLLC